MVKDDSRKTFIPHCIKTSLRSVFNPAETLTRGGGNVNGKGKKRGKKRIKEGGSRFRGSTVQRLDPALLPATVNP
jgi:hypothetical protein